MAAGAKKWTWEENKAFELALDVVPDTPANLEIIAAQMGKPVAEITYHYEKLVQDVEIIESGGVVVPEYSPTQKVSNKGTSWSAQEHERFLEGLKSEGPRAWGLISRNFVKTRDRKQVKTHGTNYLKKQLEAEKNKKQNVEVASTKEDQGNGSDLKEQSGVLKTDDQDL